MSGSAPGTQVAVLYQGRTGTAHLWLFIVKNGRHGPHQRRESIPCLGIAGPGGHDQVTPSMMDAASCSHPSPRIHLRPLRLSN